MQQEKMGILDIIINDLYSFIPTCILNESIGLENWDIATAKVYSNIRDLEELKKLFNKLIDSSKICKKDRKIINKFLGIEDEKRRL